MPWIEIFQFFLHIFIIWIKLSIFGEKKLEKSFIFDEKIEFENSVFFNMGTLTGQGKFLLVQTPFESFCLF